MPGLVDLLRPPAHRGPLIAAGSVLLTVGVALEELRLDDELSTGPHLLILALASAVMLALGLQARTEGGRPPAFQSVLLVCGLLLLGPALLTLADVLGADFSEGIVPAGTLMWTALVLAGTALWPAITKRSAVCALIAALAVAIAALAFVDWVSEGNSTTLYRWLLAVAALGYVIVSLLLRGPAPRHSEQLVNAAGLAVFAIALTGLVGAVTGFISPFGSTPDELLPNGWELVVLFAGCGLVAYGAVDRAPGAAYLGVANLAAFVVLAGLSEDETLLYWPLLLLVLGLGAMFAGLRPRTPLPDEPDAYRSGSVPMAARTDEEVVVRVRDDAPPRP